jgi:hypothetical protein
MTHLSIDERLVAIDDAEAARHPHLAVCEQCRRAVAGDRALLDLARAVDVPEPSPLFWDHFSARVAARLREEPGSGRARARLPWRFLAPLAATVTLLVVIVVIGTRPASPPLASAGFAPAVPSASATATVDQGAADDDAWALLGQLAGDFDVETLGDSLGHSFPGGSDPVVWQLNDGERAELTRLLQAENPAVRSGVDHR